MPIIEAYVGAMNIQPYVRTVRLSESVYQKSGWRESSGSIDFEARIRRHSDLYEYLLLLTKQAIPVPIYVYGTVANSIIAYREINLFICARIEFFGHGVHYFPVGSLQANMLDLSNATQTMALAVGQGLQETFDNLSAAINNAGFNLEDLNNGD